MAYMYMTVSHCVWTPGCMCTSDVAHAPLTATARTLETWPTCNECAFILIVRHVRLSTCASSLLLSGRAVTHGWWCELYRLRLLQSRSVSSWSGSGRLEVTLLVARSLLLNSLPAHKEVRFLLPALLQLLIPCAWCSPGVLLGELGLAAAFAGGEPIFAAVRDRPDARRQHHYFT